MGLHLQLFTHFKLSGSFHIFINSIILPYPLKLLANKRYTAYTALYVGNIFYCGLLS